MAGDMSKVEGGTHCPSLGYTQCEFSGRRRRPLSASLTYHTKEEETGLFLSCASPHNTSLLLGGSMNGASCRARGTLSTSTTTSLRAFILSSALLLYISYSSEDGMQTFKHHCVLRPLLLGVMGGHLHCLVV